MSYRQVRQPAARSVATWLVEKAINPLTTMETVIMANSIKTAIRKHLLAGIAKQAGVDALIQELDAARAGMYTHGVLAAIAAKGDAKAFSETCETLADDFRFNRRGIAVKFNCEQAKDKQGKDKVDADGNPIYKVPSSLSAMRSHLTQAIEHGVDLGTASKPNPYRAIKDAKDVAKAEAATANLSADDKAKQATRETLLAIADRVDALEGKALKAAIALINATAKEIDKAA